MGMKFCIRDDDTSFYTLPERLETVFGGVWDVCPVTLACVPYISPDTDAHANSSGTTPRDIGENSALTEFVRRRLADGDVEIALHGYHHDAPGGRPEFVAASDLERKVLDGIDRLETTFETDVAVFVPPHVRLSNRGVRAVSRAGLDIVRGYGPRPREVQADPRWVTSYAKLLLFYARYGKEFRYPYPLDYGTHRELYSHRINRYTDLEWCKRAYDYIEDRDGVFCLSVHAMGLNAEGLDTFQAMVSYARQRQPEFVTAGSIFRSPRS